VVEYVALDVVLLTSELMAAGWHRLLGAVHWCVWLAGMAAGQWLQCTCKHLTCALCAFLLQVPEQARDKERREGVTQSRISLAFPLNADGSADTAEEAWVYAFLPIGPSGFRWGCVHALPGIQRNEPAASHGCK
jgi:hypothetical protein